MCPFRSVMYHFPLFTRHAVGPMPSAPSPASTSPKPAFWDAATRTLGRGDPVLRRLIRKHPDVHLQRRGDPFTTLARAIVGQQISVKAAQTIWGRLATPAAAPRAPRNTAPPK